MNERLKGRQEERAEEDVRPERRAYETEHADIQSDIARKSRATRKRAGLRVVGSAGHEREKDETVPQ